jgi:hypothetical protein
MGGIPLILEMGTRALIRLASYYVQIRQEAGIAPSCLGACLPRNGDIAPATDSIVLIARLCVDDTPWIYSLDAQQLAEFSGKF